jgi:hypothetical protein
MAHLHLKNLLLHDRPKIGKQKSAVKKSHAGREREHHVERIIGRLVLEHAPRGVITRVIPNKFDFMTQYEVNFDNRLIAKFYETQLRLIEPAKDSK